LFGPRGTGKSYLIRENLKNVNYINLLKSETFLRLKTHPSELSAMITESTVAIDEIQRIPELLNEVHHLIEERGIKFLLTGSSARQLKRGGANLLAGRALRADLFPMTWKELSDEGLFELNKYLTFGGLPAAWLDEEPWEYLYAYVDTYLREEIQAEALVRNLGNYSRFLHQSAVRSSEILNYTNIGSDAQISPNTARDYFQILEDTLIGYFLEPWTQSSKRKSIQTAKFYLFDCGVTNAIRGTKHVDEGTELYGRMFEQFLCNELKSYISYTRKRASLNFWRSTTKFEVDFIVDGRIAIEVKASKRLSERDHKGLNAINEEPVKWERILLVSRDRQYLRFDSGIEHMYWEDFLRKLWSGEIF
jgi:predicted AAA+ superfamily ATPase